MLNYAQNIETAKNALVAHSYYQSALDLFEFDSWQALPKNGRAFRGSTAAFMSEQAGALLRTPQIRRTADFFRTLSIRDPSVYASPLDFAIARRFVRLSDRAARVPAALDAAFVEMALRNQLIWREARAAADFELYKPYMKELFALRQKIAEALDPTRPPYQVMVDLFDEGLDIQQVCRLFDQLKQTIPTLLRRVDPAFTKTSAPAEFSAAAEPERMKRVVRAVIDQTGMCTDNFCFAEVVHPICYCIGPRDVRVTLNYHSGIWQLLLSAMHECGHGRYSCSSDTQIADAGLWGCIDGAINEGVARFYENLIGRSMAFISFAYPYVAEQLPVFRQYSVEQIYHAVNHVHPNPQRITADEVSYSLHPIIRFEMEKDYFEGNTSIDDFREIWNEAYRRYLGVIPENDREGILQDISWSSGYLGYFQSYTLGNLYSAQLRAAMLEQIPDAYARIEAGDFSAINNWMCTNLFRYGKTQTGSEAIIRITGQPLDASYFIAYLTEKYTGSGR